MRQLNIKISTSIKTAEMYLQFGSYFCKLHGNSQVEKRVLLWILSHLLRLPHLLLLQADPNFAGTLSQSIKTGPFQEMSFGDDASVEDTHQSNELGQGTLPGINGQASRLGSPSSVAALRAHTGTLLRRLYGLVCMMILDFVCR